MPIAPNLITVAEIVLRGISSAGGSSAKNINLVFHYRRVATAVNPTKAALDTVFQATVAVPVIAALNARFTQGSTFIRWMNDAQDAYSSFAHAVVGGVGGDSMPDHEAAFLLYRTGLRGRSYRGSKHLGPMSEADTTGGTDDIFNAASLARLATAAAAMILPLPDATPNTWNPCVLSRVNPAQYIVNPTTVVSNDAISVSINKRVGTMRRRRVASIY
jgi:hypothetical protein